MYAVTSLYYGEDEVSVYGPFSSIKKAEKEQNRLIELITKDLGIMEDEIGNHYATDIVKIEPRVVNY